MCREFSKKCSLMAKGLAILLLLNYHLFEDARAVADLRVDYRPFPLEAFLTFSKFGNVSVAVFVFLTAYGITMGLKCQEKITVQTMYRQALKRMLKLIGNFLALYISVIAVWLHWFDLGSLYGGGKQGFLYLLADALGFAQILDTPTLNMTWWYMEIAYVLIFLVPLLFLLVQKTGYSLLPIVFFVPAVLELNPDITRYLFTAAVGVCAAYGNWRDRLLNLKLHPVVRWAAGCAGLVLCVLVRQNFLVQDKLLHLADAGAAVFLVWFAAALPGSVPLVKNILEWLGRYSMNIFMVHTFFYLILWRQYIYGLRYAGAIFAALLLASLVYSVLLEWIKKGAAWGFQRLRSIRRPGAGEK